MSNQEMMRKFIDKAPFAVMTRLATGAVIAEELDQVFQDHRQQQYERNVKFSAVAMAVADVALNFSENFNQAYKVHRQQLGVAITSFYDKIKATDTSVSEAVVAKAAERASQLQDALGLVPWEILPGYRVFGVDGNVLAKTDKRLGVLREAAGAPLPGKVVARFDLQRQLFDRAYLLEDAHDQESATCDRLVEDLLPNEVLVADRHYCIVRFLTRIALARGFFIIRQHGRLKGVLLGKRKRLGRTSSGMVYEQAMKLSADEDALVVRRITVELDTPTRDGETEIHVLTNLPAKVDGRTISDVYRLRWEEENAFHVLQMTLTCESTSVGHPRAALLLFCMSMLAYNIRQVIFAALSAEHGDEQVEQVSHFHISKEVSRYTEGMLVALDDEAWDELSPRNDRGLVGILRRIARGIRLVDYQKSRRGPKKKKPNRSRNVKSSHVSTAKLLGIA
ncbi:MAG: transposase [Pirellulales bacterium]